MMPAKEQRTTGLKKDGAMNAKGWMSAMMALLGWWSLSGCVPVPVSGGQPTTSTLSETRKPMSAEIEYFYPKAVRSGDVASIQLIAKGIFTDAVVKEQTYSVTPQRKLSVGILPGMASLDPVSAVGGTLLAVWYNILFVGTPTLNGLFIEPFNPDPVPDSESVNDGHAFRRSALLGFHKYELAGRSGRGVPEEKRVSAAGTRSVSGVDFAFEADSASDPSFWTGVGHSDDRGTVYLYGVAPGKHVGRLVLEKVPPGHYMRKDLPRLVGFEMKVEIPAE
ncbi:MAG: hypothetical protein IKQ55_01995 [Kiritimatiellae bacterium]|nr:hypothetical protein [Kiritimatiellia bacterium]